MHAAATATVALKTIQSRQLEPTACDAADGADSGAGAAVSASTAISAGVFLRRFERLDAIGMDSAVGDRMQLLGRRHRNRGSRETSGYKLLDGLNNHRSHGEMRNRRTRSLAMRGSVVAVPK